MHSKFKRGFSILEVLITAGIIGIITALVVVKYGSFNNAVLLKSQAYEIALDLRETQVYALSVRGEAGEFREDYGLHFDVADPGSYILFLDQGTVIENGKNMAYYEAGEEVGAPYIIDSRFTIQRICVNSCTTDVADISVTFKRPDFDAQFASHDGLARGVGDIADAQIQIANILDTTAVRTIEISPTGQIDVD